MTPGRLKVWNEAASAWEYVNAPGGSQSSLSTPDAVGDTDPITAKTGDSSGGRAGDITITAGSSAGAEPNGADVIVKAGSGADSSGNVQLKSGEGDLRLQVHRTATLINGDFDCVSLDGDTAFVVESAGIGAPKLAFFNATTVEQPVVPLTTPTVQDVIDALVALGLVSQSD